MVFIALVLFLFLFAIALYPDLLKVLQEATFLKMLQAFVKKDVVGIV